MALGQRVVDLARLVDLQHVALLDVLEVAQDDPAFEARRDLPHVLVEASQRCDLAVVDDRAVAHEPGPRAARDLAVGDVGAGDDTDPRRAEELTDLDVTKGVLDLIGFEHALHRGTQLVQNLVDHRVVADLDALPLAHRAGVADGPHVEADDDRVGRRGKHDVGLVDAADAGADDVHRHLVLRQLGDLVLERLGGAGDVGLDEEVELLELARLDLLEDVLQRALAARAPRVLLLLEALLALVRELAGAAVVLDDADVLAGLRNAVEAEHLDRVAREGLLDAVAGEVVERAHAAPVGARDERVADAQRAALDEDGDDRAAAGIELGLDDDAGGRSGRVGLELLDLGDDLQRVEQVLETDLRLGRDVD